MTAQQKNHCIYVLKSSLIKKQKFLRCDFSNSRAKKATFSTKKGGAFSSRNIF